ncbi:MAG: DUF2809 domain-containing protein [Thermoguttaceae bacterium]|nr:DUF2809 domain-containing protein [Thermoguttaceae bacterium]
MAVEVLIALYVRDRLVRPYLGDVLVVILLYCLVRSIKPDGLRLLPLTLFLFAAAVEATQAIPLVRLLGWEDIPFLATLLGTSFSWWDMLCYAVGCLFCHLPDWLLQKGATLCDVGQTAFFAFSNASNFRLFA